MPSHSMVLMQGARDATLEVWDTTEIGQPRHICTILSAQWGRFFSSLSVGFSSGGSLGEGQLSLTGEIKPIGQTTAYPGLGAFNYDGTFAYESGSLDGTATFHIFREGVDHAILTFPPIGSHGGAPWGPTQQMQFSSDGQYVLDFNIFRQGAGPPAFIVFRRDGSIAFQSATAEFGTWSLYGNKLYFLVPDRVAGVGGVIHSWDPVAGDVALTRMSSYFWPAMSLDGEWIAYTAYSPADSCGGLPHIWRLDLDTLQTSQLVSGLSSHPVFAGRAVWFNQEIPVQCGPGGESSRNGVVVSHDIDTRAETEIEVEGGTQFWADVWIIRD